MSYIKNMEKIAGIAGAKAIVKKISDTGEYMINKTSLMPWDADELNRGEEDRLRDFFAKKEKSRVISPLKRNVSTWSGKDLECIMNSKEYQYDDYTQKKVRSYFEWKYPGNQKLDATGRPIK